MTPEVINTVVVRRDQGVEPSVAKTAAAMPDIAVRVMSPVAVVLVRALRVYLQTLVGLLGTGAIASGMVPPDLLPAGDFAHALRVAAGMSLGPAFVCAAQNTIELLGRLDERLPQLRP